MLLPKGNKHSLDDVPQIIKKGMEFILIDTVDEAIERIVERGRKHEQ